MRTHTKN